MKKAVFKGCATAIVTPFKSDSIDFDAFRKLIDHQLNSGIDALVVCGTTGEASTMTQTEQMLTIETAIHHVDGKIPIIAGTGANSTETAISKSKDAAALGADALLIVTPYYNKTTQQGLIRHYTKIADSVDKPVIVYNVPSRTGVCCTAETYAELSAHPNIIGVKEASGNFALIQKTRELCPEDFYIWSGNDEDTAAIMLLGGAGVISVVSNVAPREMAKLAHACLSNRFAEAGEMQIHMRRLCEVLFCEVNPIPVKSALALMGCCSEIFRLPLCEMTTDNREKLKKVLADYSLL